MYIRTKRNVLTLTRTSDPTNICTRLYPLGEGEGVNQLNIRSINNGRYYIESPQNYIDKYGIVERIWIDRRYTNQQSLYDAAVAMLGELQEPLEEYEVEFAQLGNDSYDVPAIGKIVEIVDFKKTFVTGIKFNHSEVPKATLTIANKPKDIASTVADIADRQRIEMSYAQGATQFYQDHVYDNATPTVSLQLKLMIPSDMKIVNKVLIDVEVGPFRKPFTVTGGGGSQTISQSNTSSSGASTTTTTASGGSFNTTSSSGGSFNQTSSAGGSFNTTSSAGGGFNTTSDSGGGFNTTSSSGGGYTPTTDSNPSDTSGSSSQSTSGGGGSGTSGPSSQSTSGGGGGTQVSSTYSFLSGYGVDSVSTASTHTHSTSSGNTGSGGSHTHLMPNFAMRGEVPSHRHDMQHIHQVYDHRHDMQHYHSIPTHRHSVSIPSHTHTVSVGSHSHSLYVGNHTHTLNVASHTHSLSVSAHTHTLNVASHTHDMQHYHSIAHTHSIPNHTHTLNPGISFAGNPSSFDVLVNGVKINTTVGKNLQLNITEFLTDNQNKIPRDTYNRIEIVPNDNAYVQLTVNVQGFIQSRGDIAV